MSDLDRPATRREVREDLTHLRLELTTKAEFREGLAQLRAELATKAELRDSIEVLREEMATGFVEMREYVEFSATSLRNELRTHFDLTTESFRSEFRNLYDWTLATTTSLAARIEALEKRDASGTKN